MPTERVQSNGEPSARIERLREHALKTSVPSLRSAEGELLWYRGWMDAHDSSSLLVRRGKAKGHLLASSTPVIDPGTPEGIEPCEFYLACEAALEGLLRYAAAYADHARARAAAASPQRRTELEAIGRTLDRVPAYPATCFREALQSVHFLTFCLGGLYQLGRPDRYLIDFYRRDLAAGRLTAGEAQELIDCLCILCNEYVPRGLAVGLMVGGRDCEGQDVSNELSSMFVEITPVACSAVWVASPYINLAAPLLEMLDVESSHEESSPELGWDSFEAFKTDYRSRLGAAIKKEAAAQNRLQAERYHAGGDPLVSCFVRDCISRGMDVDRGGFELQINVVDQDVLIHAKDDPAAYQDLVVRIGGYSDYFVRLSPSMQDELIERTGHRI